MSELLRFKDDKGTTMDEELKTVYDYESAIDDLLDDALNKPSPKDYETLLDHIDIALADRNPQLT